MWPFNLSVRLLIVDLVGRYPANYLIRREPIFARIAPLTPWPCDLGASCGISTNFSVLSPSQRQVAHALLTRPPLTFIRSKLPNQSVRLECVMHAASVYPEPGSNSLKKYSHGTWYRNHLFRAFSLALTYFFLRVFRVLIDTVYFLRNQRVSALFPRLSLFNFQGPNFRRLFCDSLSSIPHHFPFVKTFFNFFQKIFSTFPGPLRGTPALSRGLDYLTTTFPVCQPPFFDKNRCFFTVSSPSAAVFS